MAYYEENKYEEAIKDFDSALNLVEASAKSGDGTGAAVMKGMLSGFTYGLIPMNTTPKQPPPARGDINFFKGLCLNELKRPEEAEKAFKLAFEESPKMEETWQAYIPYEKGGCRTFWAKMIEQVHVIRTKMTNGDLQHEIAEQQAVTSQKESQEKLSAVKSLFESNQYKDALSSMMEYLKGDPKRLSSLSAECLEQITLGSAKPDTAFNLTAVALQTHINGDSARAKSLAHAAAVLMKSQPDSAVNEFCKSRLLVVMPDIADTIGDTAPSVDLEVSAHQLDPNRPIKDKWAVIVGIGNFSDKSISPLKYPPKDARDFYEFLIKDAKFSPDHIRLLLNEKATQRRILTELGDKFLPRVARKDDLVVIYFSSHGSPSRVDVKQKNYLVAYDTEKSNLFASGIEMQELTQLIKSRVDSDRVLIVMDACHSGAADANAKDAEPPSNFNAEAIAQGTGQLVICSSQPTEKSWESKRYSNGVFTHCLIEGLKKNGASTRLGNAFDSTKSSVHNEVQEDEGIGQTPVLKSKWNGNDLLLSVPPSEPRKLPDAVKQILSPDSAQDQRK